MCEPLFEQDKVWLLVLALLSLLAGHPKCLHLVGFVDSFQTKHRTPNMGADHVFASEAA